MKKKLLWHGDAACASGFSRCTHGALDVLRHSYDVSVIGINHTGDPHPYPYDIYPAARAYRNDDMFGVSRLAELTPLLKPDAIVLLNDPWNIPAYLPHAGDVPVAAWVAVDGKNCRGEGMNGLALAVFWTQFALDEARAGGYTGPAAIVPLGVDIDTYRPLDRAFARSERGIGLPEHMRDWFVVGAVGRNQPRKRLDLTIDYFADWVRTRGIDDACLFLHVAPTGERGYDLDQLVKYYGLTGRVVKVAPRNLGVGLSESSMAWVYACFDAQLTTTQGEGWGLCTMEGMACGVPQVVPDWSALGEWTEDAALKVPCTSVAHTPDTINVVGGVPDRAGTLAALDRLYYDRDARETLARRGLALAQQPRYRWPAIGAAFQVALDAALAAWSPAPHQPDLVEEAV